MLRQKGVGETEECLTGRYSHKGKNGVGLHRGDGDAARSDGNRERSDEESGGVRVIIDQRDRVSLSAA